MAEGSSPAANDEPVGSRRMNGQIVGHAWNGRCLHKKEQRFRETLENFMLHAGEHVRDTCASLSPTAAQQRLVNELVSCT